MPEVATVAAKVREAFGEATIDEAVARGKAGEPTFWLGRMTGPSERSRGQVPPLVDRRARASPTLFLGCAGAWDRAGSAAASREQSLRWKSRERPQLH